MSPWATNRAKILRRLGAEGWRLIRNGAEHDVYAHDTKPGILIVPRHREMSPGVARQIAKVAGWI